jgi:hypothetical protein
MPAYDAPMSTSSNRVVQRPQGAVISWLFNPLRTRVQRGVDCRFDRARYDGERTAGEFAERLRWETDMDRVTGDLRVTVASAIAPSSLGVWLRKRGAAR